MRTPLLVLALLSFVSFALVAETGRIAGMLQNARNEEAVPFATISVFELGKIEATKSAVSNIEGRFIITDVPFGKYYLKVEFLSFEPYLSDTFTLSTQNPFYKAGKIGLKANMQELGGVAIEAEKSQVELSLDKRVYNVGQDLNSRGGSAEDILNNVPSVTVDVDGAISLRGSGNVRILVDGKPSGLIGTGSGSGLRQIPASLIDKIEVVTNPSARYDAEGQAGIINIVLKKEERMGVNGSFEVSAGLPVRLGAAANVNYRKKHFNLFLNYGANISNNPGYGLNDQKFSPGDTTFYTYVNRDHNRGGWSNSVKMGSDFFWGKNNTLTGSFLYKYSNEDNVSNLTYEDYDENEVLTSLTTRKDYEKELENDLEWSLNYTKKFDAKDKHKLTADVRYVLSTETEDSEIEQLLNQQSLPTLQAVLNEEYERNIIGNIDYNRPFGKKGLIETGLRSTLRNINNPYLVEDLVDDEWVKLTNFSNTLYYTENVHAAYLMAGNELKRFSYQVGLRAEYTEIETYLEETNSRYPRNYFNLFPTAHFTYKQSIKNSFQLSYSRRINRPSFWNLNPFYSFTDPRNFHAGNPNLNPEFTHSFEAGHMFFYKGGSLLSSIYFRHSDDVFERITTSNGDNTTLSIPVNLSTQDAIGIEMNHNQAFGKKLRLTTNANFYKQNQSGEYEGVLYQNEALTFSGRSNMQFTFLKNVNGQMSFNYRAPRSTPQGFSRSVWHSDLGFAGDFMKGNASWNISVRDMFNTRKRRGWTDIDGYYSYSEFQWRSRYIMGTITYRLNQNKNRQPVLGRDGGDGDE
ncbi:MAG: TonB-dependent receptor [Bacteroidetes bacterium]|nr:TonB-dependent receptor [Bacteroidota bacterium]